MSGTLQLRRGERFNPDEFPADALEQLHDRLDAIAAEQDDEPSEVTS